MTRGRDSAAKPGQGGFASRWSQRKQAAKLVPPSEAEAEAAPAEAEADAPVDDRPDAEILEELGLPDPDQLKSGDDFSAFMAKAVPARLRHRALRRLWVSDPVYANLDNLVDYAEDFSYAGNVGDVLRTAYQVGKGFVDAIPEEPEPGDLPDPPEDGAEAGDNREHAAESLAPEPPVQDLVGGGDAEQAETTAPADVSGATIAPRARMRFRMVEE